MAADESSHDDFVGDIERAMLAAREACVKICNEEFAGIALERDVPEQHRNAWEQCCVRIATRIRETVN